jgi:GPI mannosyltransferase 3
VKTPQRAINDALPEYSAEPPVTAGPSHFFARHHLIIILGAAFLIRIAALNPNSLMHPDEIGQYLEQSYRLLNGYGVVPWEYRAGMRHWLFPILLAGPMALGHALAPDTLLNVILPKTLTIIFSLGIVWSAYRLGRVVSQTHAIIAAIASAFWFEMILFSGHTLTEPVATSAILCASALLYSKPLLPRHLFIAGLLLGLSFILRFHYAPAIAVIGIFALASEFKTRIVPLFLGGLTALLIGSAIDVYMGMTPFYWVYENIHQNIILKKAATFGVDGPEFYPIMLIAIWSFSAIPIVLLNIVSFKKYRPLFYAATLNFIIHSFIGHKEYRFIFLSTIVFFILAVIGSVDIMKVIQNRTHSKTARSLPYILVLLWIFTSAALVLTSPRTRLWQHNGTMEMMTLAGRDPQLCGIAIREKGIWMTGLHSYLKRDVPIVSLSESDLMLTDNPRFNRIIAADNEPSRILNMYKKHICVDSADGYDTTIYGAGIKKICLYKRLGSCDQAASQR